MIEGKRSRGAQRKRWKDNIFVWTQQNTQQLNITKAKSIIVVAIISTVFFYVTDFLSLILVFN